ncbi:WD repeat-containing protein JIP5 [Candida viswanathii]|uniref:WD repeat-containing protein JIP5 n=1 Tax=Candida viswanathii TaxID=5486 RepID=A0A367YBS2_9ASCO|nr:WD repeat-containing protein JIP5 [Candida viswanathii]
MAKKKSNSTNAAQVLESSVSPILEVNYADPLFTAAAHPTKPILISGQVTGHVYCNTYDAEKLEEQTRAKREEYNQLEKEAYSKGKIPHVNKSVSQLKSKWWTVILDNSEIPKDGDLITTNWKTKRHKGACRHAIFEPLENSVGEFIYTCGTDNIIKKAATETGKVLGKVDVLTDYSNAKDALTKLCHSTTHPFLLSGTEDGHVLVYDSSNLNTNKLKFKVDLAHDDSINHILAMPAVSAYHYLTLGSTTLSHIDIRKGIITQSDDQEDELLAMCYPSTEISEQNDTVLVTHGEGIISVWKNSKNKLMDQLTRVKVNKTASIDAIVPTMNVDDESLANSVWCGDSEGLLHRVNYKSGKVVETRLHSVTRGKYGAVDEVGILDIDYDYRLISAGMDTLKIWSNTEVDDEEASDDDDSDDVEDGDQDSWTDTSDSGSEGEDEEDGEQDENVEEEDEKHDTLHKRRANISEIISKPKRKLIDINKLTKSKQSAPTEEEPEEEDDEPAEKKQKVKEKKLSTKQLRNMQKHEHGIRKFEGL